MTTFTSHEDGMPCWVDAMVSNEEEHHDKRAFLTALFDWTWDLGGPEMGHYATARSNGAPVVGLGIMDGGHGRTTTYFSTSNIEEAITQATGLGATVMMPAMAVMDLGTMAVLFDPAGAPYGLWQPGTFAGFGVMHEVNAPGWFDHVSPDPERDGEYYSAVSGHQLTNLDGDMRILQNGENWYASISHAQSDEPPQWKPIWVVDSFERIHETVPRLGGAIVIEEMPVPGSAICVFSEPVNGNLMTVMRGGEHPE
jgi:predicted enzyme related to lactoylglutathione lyase